MTFRSVDATWSRGILFFLCLSSCSFPYPCFPDTLSEGCRSSLLLSGCVLIGWPSQEYFFVPRAGDCNTEDILTMRGQQPRGLGQLRTLILEFPRPKHVTVPPPQKDHITWSRVCVCVVFFYTSPIYLGFLVIILSRFSLEITL